METNHDLLLIPVVDGHFSILISQFRRNPGSAYGGAAVVVMAVVLMVVAVVLLLLLLLLLVVVGVLLVVVGVLSLWRDHRRSSSSFVLFAVAMSCSGSGHQGGHQVGRHGSLH